MKFCVLIRRALLVTVLLVAALAPLGGFAQESDPVPATDGVLQADVVLDPDLEEERVEEEESDWAVAIGLASFSVPRYAGDDDLESLVVPNVELRFKDKINLSFLTGLSYNLLGPSDWKAGPLLDYDFGRDSNPELLGFEEIDAGLELGAVFEYVRQDVTAKVKILRGVGGHDGTSVTATLRHARLYDTGLIPLYFLIGPALRVGDSEYLNTFFGVTEQQSISSGLAQTRLNAGLISYGLDAVLVVPLSRNVFIRNFFLLEVLSGDVARSPVVTNQGDNIQRTLGIEFGYLF